MRIALSLLLVVAIVWVLCSIADDFLEFGDED